jgi:hypothetical protein
LPPGNQFLDAREPWVPDHGYVLLLKSSRLEELEADLTVQSMCSQAIPKLPTAMRRRPMLCFIGAKRGWLTHVARSVSYYPAESGRDKLDIWNLTELPTPVRISALKRKLEGRQSWRTNQALLGGHVSSTALKLLMQALHRVAPDSYAAAAALVDSRDGGPEGEPSRARINWALQRDAVVTALEIARMPNFISDVPGPPDGEPAPKNGSIFDSDEPMVSIEDLTILHDLDRVGEDWIFLTQQRYPAKTYVNGETKLTLILANKLELEKQLGVDLVYYNETHNSVVFVQYKMFAGLEGEDGYRPDKQLEMEIARMDAAAAELAKLPRDETCAGYRIAQDPFFLKFCAKLMGRDEKGHAPGVYVPLGFWKLLVDTPQAKGPRGGKVVYDHTFERRRFTPTVFVDLVGRGWIGTSALQSKALLFYLRNAVQGGKGVVFAVQTGQPVDTDRDGDARATAPKRRKHKYPGRKPKRRKHDWSI